MTLFWLKLLGVPNHLLTTNLADMPSPFAARAGELQGRTMLVRKAEVVPIECVVRGYLAGSGWKEYRQHGTVCGLTLPPGLRESQQLPEPIFTPATKEESGHDINISFARMAALTGPAVADELRRRSLDVYNRAAEYVRQRGILIADTKVEWGKLPGGDLILIDEVLTPDSSRFWPLDQYSRAAVRRRSTSSSSATGWRRPAGTRTARRRSCRPRSSAAPGRSTWKPMSD